MSISTQLCEKLLQIKAIKLSPQNPFTWASGIKSPIYCDNRVTLSYSEVRNIVKAGLIELASYYKFDAIAGVATAGIAHGALLADSMNMPYGYVRSEAKVHGRKNKIEGDFSSFKSVLIVEDLISTGGSSIQVAEVLREEGFEAAAVISIFDYGFEMSKLNFASKNLDYKSITNYKELLHIAVQSGYIKNEELKALENWAKDPENWNSDI